MFTKEEIASIDKEYFYILSSNAFQITMQSRNTKHEWHILCRENILHGRTISSCVISHRHNRQSGFHIHGQAASLADAIEMIKKHDSYMMSKGGGNNGVSR